MIPCAITDCDNEAQEGQEYCKTHRNLNRGNGASQEGTCMICGRSQRDHKIGYPEHWSHR